MAKLGVTAAGAVVGGVLGSFVGNPMLGAQIGWAVGGLASSFVGNKDQQGPRVAELTIQGSAYGNPIPLVSARAKLAGNVIWCDDIIERKSKKKAGKGGPKVVNYTYYLSFAVGLCEWLNTPVNPGVLRIWLDDKLVYDSVGSGAVTKVSGLVWRFYPGSATQTPDPLIEADVGTNDAPAFRDMAYIVFEELPIDSFGRRMPNVTVELSAEISLTFPQVNATGPASPEFPTDPSGNTYMVDWPTSVAVDYNRGRVYQGRTRSTGYTAIGNDEVIRVYDLATLNTIAEYKMGDMVEHLFGVGETPTADSVGAGIMHMGVDGYLYVTGGLSNRTCLWKIDPDAMRAVGVFGPPAGDGFGFGDDGTRLVSPMAINSVSIGGGSKRVVVVQGAYSVMAIDAATMTYIWGAADLATSPPPISYSLGLSPLTYPFVLVPGAQDGDEGEMWVFRGSDGSSPYQVEVTRLRFTTGAADLGGGVASGVQRTDYTAIGLAAIDASASYCNIQCAYYDATDETFVITVAGAGSPATNWSRFTTFKWSPVSGVVWSIVNHNLPSKHDARGFNGRVLSNVWGLAGNFVLTPSNGDTVIDVAGNAFNSLGWIDEAEAAIGYVADDVGTYEIAKRYLTRKDSAQLTLGDIVGALCEKAGLTVSDYDVSELTDNMPGYMIPRPMPARDAITVLAAGWLFDAAVIDDVLYFRKRGGATVATVAYTDMVRENPDESIIEEERIPDAEIPREVMVRFLDWERGWEPGAQSWARSIAPTATTYGRGTATIEIAVPLSGDDAKTIARRMVLSAARERTRVRFSVGPKHARIVPTDPIIVGTRDGASVRVRVTAVDDGANWVRRIEGVTEDAATYDLTATADSGGYWLAPTIPAPYYTRMVYANLPLLADGDDLNQAALREYAIAAAYDGANWNGVTVYRSPDNATWTELGSVAGDGAPWGTVTAIPDPPASPWVWDETGELVVRMTDGEPESATEIEVLNWANLGALIDGDGNAELIQWKTATDNGDGTFTLTSLLRGRRGTEDQIDSRAIGNMFVILDESVLAYSDTTTSDTTTRYHRAASVFDTADTARPTVTKSLRGRAEQPYAVCQVVGTRDGSDNLDIEWLRRARYGGEWLDGTGSVTLGEASEDYEVDIYNGPLETDKLYSDTDAFDGNSSTFVLKFGPSVGDPLTEYVQFLEAQTIREYGIKGHTSITTESPQDWTLEGLDPTDGVTWTVIDTVTGETGWSAGELRRFTVTEAEWLGLRWKCSASNGASFVTVFEFEGYATVGGPAITRTTYARSVVRLIDSLSSPAATYSAADQVTDWGVEQPIVYAAIYQISAIVGRGIAAEVTL